MTIIFVYLLNVQIYVEVERARLTHKLAQIKEEEGNITEAANIIQELQVETYGSMEKREKVCVILLIKNVSYTEKVRYNLHKQCCFINLGVKKINVKK